MDVRRLKSFILIADFGSISKAAAEAGLAQPALSQHLAALESELKVKLVDRSARGVTLTKAGEALYGRARIVLQQIDDLQADVSSEANRLSGPVAVGIPPSMVSLITLPLLQRMCAEHPEVRLQIVEEASVRLGDLLSKGGLDLVLSPRRIDASDIQSELLFNEPLMLVTPKSWGISSPPSLVELSRFAWITTRRTHSVRVLVEAALAAVGLEYKVAAEIDSLTTVVRAVRLGLGATVLPRNVAREAAGVGDVDILPFGEASRPMFLCARRSVPPSHATLSVMQVIRDLVAKVPQES